MFSTSCVENKTLQTQDSGITEKLSKVVLPIYKSPLKGSLNILKTNITIKEQDMQIGAKEMTQSFPKIGMFQLRVNGSYVLAAFGKDGKYHFPNSFIIGFRPFEISSPIEAWKALDQRVVYVKDTDGNKELDLWFTSAETFENLRGDCEDKALLLADWLISSGYDARVAIGTYKGEGHAWVVLKAGGEWYLLEATRAPEGDRLQLAKEFKDYKPEFMFNNKYIWQNMNNSNDYEENHWEETMIFRANKGSQSILRNPGSTEWRMNKRNFYEDLLSDGVLMRWPKSQINYYFESNIKNPEIKSKCRQAFQSWHRKTGFLTFKEVFSSDQADITIKMTTDTSFKTSFDTTIPRSSFKFQGTEIKEISIYKASIELPEAPFKSTSKNHREIQKMLIHSIGILLGLGNSGNPRDCLSEWNNANPKDKDCDNLTAEINTLGVIYDTSR